jgi:small ligand-binding sensory domain FIST
MDRHLRVANDPLWKNVRKFRMTIHRASSSKQFASALSTDPQWRTALESVCQECLSSLDGKPDLAFLLVSADRAHFAAPIAAQAAALLNSKHLLGCTAESIVGGNREIEGEPAISLWLARLPDVSLTSMALTFQATPDGGSILGWPDELLGDWGDNSSMLVLGEPFSFPADFLLERLNDDRPGVSVIGGMASGGTAPGQNRLLLGSQIRAEGAVAVVLRGGAGVRSIVSQGCRPVGRPFVVTRSERNVIYELGGVPAFERLREVFDASPNRDKILMQQGLHVGRVVSEYLEQFAQGDFLVRNVVGVDGDAGTIVIGDFVRTGQTVQFHVRDESTADAELRQLLAREKSRQPPAAALLFNCNGRGSRLFSEPHHDAAAIEGAFGELPLAGFFAQGEMGPIGGRNFLHGFTASIALFDDSLVGK